MTDQFNTLIQKYSTLNNLPWRLVYRQIEQESNGDANIVESGTGALGLLQLMPSSFPSYAKEQLLDPETNIKIGSAYLKECIDEFKLEVGFEKMNFGLAAYNAGLRNILQAQAISKANSYPSSCWAPVSLSLVKVTGIKNALQTAWYVWKIMTDYTSDISEAMSTAKTSAPAK